MKIIETKLVNGISGDPSVYGFFPKTGDAVLFDLGSIENLSNKEILRIRVVLVSHTHIDHFIGFDRLLRVNIPHGRMIEICGPSGITKNVQGKLTSYTWNLLEPGQVKFTVHEIHENGEVNSSLLDDRNGFKPRPLTTKEPTLAKSDPSLPSKPCAYVTQLSDGTRVEAVVLDHGIPSVCYSLQSPCRYHVKEGAIEKLGLTPGAWIRELQIALSDKEIDKEFEVGGRSRKAGDIGSELFTADAPKVIGYASDLIFNKENLLRLEQLMHGVRVLICEANYCSEDHEKAREKMHLTTKQAALVAAKVKAETLQPFHISNIYSGETDKIANEAQKYFEKFLSDGDTKLENEAISEMAKNN